MQLREIIQRSILCSIYFIAVLFFYSATAHAEVEEILSFKSVVTVQENSTLYVKETIEVRALGNRIRRGIYRDFPTSRRTDFGFKRGTDFQVLSVRRNGAKEPYALEDIGGGPGGDSGKRIRIGQKSHFLPLGLHTYIIEYQTTNQLDYTPDYDELFWNVTGNGWEFPIRQAEVSVILPGSYSSSDLSLSGFTGKAGSKEQSVEIASNSTGCHISSARPLGQREGLSIVVQWPKGSVYEPDAFEKRMLWVKYNKGSIFALLGLIGICFYYLSVWIAVGKDPEQGTIIPLYEAPDNLSPAAVRYLTKMGFDRKTVTAEILDMAVRGYLTIRELSSGYALEQTGASEELLTKTQQKMARELFSRSSLRYLLQTNYKCFQKVESLLKKSLEREHLKKHFHTNRKYFFYGALMSLGVIAISALLESVESFAFVAFMSVWLSGWSVGVAVLLFMAKGHWVGFFKGNSYELPQALFITIFALPFVGGEIIGLTFLFGAISVLHGIVVVSTGILGAVFYYLLKAPTLSGRRIMDRIEGFKMYLSVAEADGLAHTTLLDRTPEAFEKFLPYALALGVEQEWSEKFSDVLENASLGGESRGYTPRFYRGTSFANMSTFSSSFGSSFSSALSSASSSPRSSGGSGGSGGSSGGGGGGGGGGGW